jgi:hypothetical protein
MSGVQTVTTPVELTVVREEDFSPVLVLDQNIHARSHLMSMGFDCIEIEGALDATNDQLIPSLDILTNDVSTEVRAKEWETLNHKCHSVFGALPECVPPEKDLMEVQNRILMEVLIFVNIQ